MTARDIIVWSARQVGIDAYVTQLMVREHDTTETPDIQIEHPSEWGEVMARETAIRVRVALRESGHALTRRYSVVITSPGVTRGDVAFDLAIALGVLACNGVVDTEKLRAHVACGELALDGRVRAPRGTFARARAAFASGGLYLTPLSLNEAVSLVNGAPAPLPIIMADARSPAMGALPAPRWLLLVGAPGTGKTMIARRLVKTLPSLSDAEQTDIDTIADAGGLRLPDARPFRAPHHSASKVALVGGGHPVRPGEVTLAHGGVLFLDELPEFRKSAITSLFCALREGEAVISRDGEVVRMPARPAIVVAAMNPCPCGYYGEARRVCRCSADQIAHYRSRVPGFWEVIQGSDALASKLRDLTAAEVSP